MQLRDLFDDISSLSQPQIPQQGQVIPLQLQQLLRRELNVADDWHSAEDLLLTARSQLPEQLEIQIALYKLYAYSNRFSEAMDIIEQTLDAAAARSGFDNDWRRLDKQSAAWNPAHGSVRVYLYTMKAAGFVNLRSGNFEQAYAVLTKLDELDPLDQVGGSVVREMAERLLDA